MMGSWIPMRMRSGRCFTTAASACSPSSASVISGDYPADPQPPVCVYSCGLHLPLDDHRKSEHKSRALTDLRLDPDLAAVHLNDPLGDGQSQAGAALLARDRVVGLLKLLK